MRRFWKLVFENTSPWEVTGTSSDSSTAGSQPRCSSNSSSTSPAETAAASRATGSSVVGAS